MSKDPVRRIRWFDTDCVIPSTPVDWRSMAVITATLFINFCFCERYGLQLWGFGGIVLELSLLAAAALVIAALFFVGPAMAAQSARCGVFGLVANSLGAVPAFAVRLCAVVFLCIWMANLLALPTLWTIGNLPARHLDSIQIGIVAAVILLFLFFTGLQSVRTSAKLALFSNKLGLAILVAALIRVRAGWGAIPAGFPTAGQYPPLPHFCYEFSSLAAYAAPLGLLAADIASRIPEPRQVRLAVFTGVAAPLFLALFLTGAVGVALGESGLYQPSLAPTVAMALWSHVAGSAVPGRMLVAGITTFGALRFAARALGACGSVCTPGKLRWFHLASAITAVACLAVRPYFPAAEVASKATATCLTVVGAVVVADLLSGRMRVVPARSVDLIGIAALLAGLATPFCLPARCLWGHDNWWLPWLLPSYTVGFFVCFCGRLVSRQTGKGH